MATVRRTPRNSEPARLDVRWFIILFIAGVAAIVAYQAEGSVAAIATLVLVIGLLHTILA